MRSSLFWGVTQRWLMFSWRRFGTTCKFHLQGMGSTGCLETLLTKHRSTLHSEVKIWTHKLSWNKQTHKSQICNCPSQHQHLNIVAKRCCTDATERRPMDGVHAHSLPTTISPSPAPCSWQFLWSHRTASTSSLYLSTTGQGITSQHILWRSLP